MRLLLLFGGFLPLKTQDTVVCDTAHFLHMPVLGAILWVQLELLVSFLQDVLSALSEAFAFSSLN